MLTRMYVRVASALARETGATAAEYAIMASLIAVVVIVAVAAVGTATNALFSDVRLLNALQ
jgi:pilus assembly protein Flp/PilA